MRGLRSCLLLLLLAGCASYRPVSDAPVRVGKPYRVGGVTYVPAPDPDYDRVGYASWYGAESGNRTANGEKFRAKWITAAHTTLPLPTYAEVTALDTGRTILVRINDRGPYARGRILDLSMGAASELGVKATGHVPVRVRVVAPPERDRERLRHGKPARERPRLPPTELAMQRARLFQARPPTPLVPRAPARMAPASPTLPPPVFVPVPPPVLPPPEVEPTPPWLDDPANGPDQLFQ